MSEELHLAAEPVYSSCLKNRMLCKYLEIVNRYSKEMDTELARDLEELINYAKDCGKDTGFIAGVQYSDLLLQEYIDFDE